MRRDRTAVRERQRGPDRVGRVVAARTAPVAVATALTDSRQVVMLELRWGTALEDAVRGMGRRVMRRMGSERRAAVSELGAVRVRRRAGRTSERELYVPPSTCASARARF